MTDNNTSENRIEPMIDAKQAAAALRLPYYWFADHAMRTKYRIPHYLMGGLVRYRLPVVFGTVLLRGANVVWYGDLEAEPIRKKGGKK